MENSVKFYDPRQKPFEIFGLYNPTDINNGYKRIPTEVAKSVSPGVYNLHTNSAGGRIRFATDSEKIILKVKTNFVIYKPHCNPLMQYSFDLYEDFPCSYKYLGTFKFDTKSPSDYEVELNIGKGMKELTLNMALHGEVKSVLIGLDENAVLQPHTPYKNALPIVFYGSSITHGAAASRPGLSYPAYISRRFDCDYINLGFAGACKGERTLAEYMADLNMSAFVSDYDHNSNSPDHLRETHYPLYEIIRNKNPDLPYFMITRPNFFVNHEPTIQRRDIIMESYLKARANGDKNVYFIDGASFFAGDNREDFTVDCTHPTDAGFYRMASVIGDVFENVLNLNK